jgi:hypothetical protein
LPRLGLRVSRSRLEAREFLQEREWDISHWPVALLGDVGDLGSVHLAREFGESR